MNEVSFPFSSGPSSLVGHTILNQYVVSPLATSGDPPVFCHDWGIHISNWIMHPGVALEMMEKLLLPQNALSASQCSFWDVKDLFC